MNFCCRFYYFYLDFFCFSFFFPGLFVLSAGPRTNRTKQCRNQRFHQNFASSLHFTFVALFMSQQHVKEISWFTFSITCIGFFVVGSWICSICRLEALRAGCQASRGVRLRRLRWPLLIWTPAPNNGFPL